MDVTLTFLFSLILSTTLLPGTLARGTKGNGNQLDPAGESKMAEEQRKKEVVNPQKSRPRPPFLEVLQSPSMSQDADGAGEKFGKLRGTLPLWQYVQEQGKRIQEEENGIQCVCDTLDCTGAGQTTCTTAGSCYTQILELDDGSPPITRGCITGETPLLCENRIPKNTAGRPYPRLLCCKAHFCNNPHPVLGHQNQNLSSVTPRPSVHPPRGQDVTPGEFWTGSTLPGNPTNTTLTHQRLEIGPREDGPFPRTRGKEQEISLRISPLAKAWLIGGAAGVVIISVIGFIFLRRERRRRPEDVVEAGNVMNGDVVTLEREVPGVKATGSELLLPPCPTLDSISAL